MGDDSWVLEDLGHFLCEAINARWSNWVDNLAHTPEEQVFDDSRDLVESQPVLNAYRLKVLHRIEHLDTMAEERGRVGRELNRLLRELENERLVRQQYHVMDTL